MNEKHMVIRQVTREECPWLDHNIEKGTTVYKYCRHTYGCISSKGLAVSLEADKDPFFEIPKDALDFYSSTHG